MKILPTASLFFVVGAFTTAFATVTIIESLPYKEGMPEAVLDLYLPDSSEKKAVVLVIHGGGWTSGSRKGNREVAVAHRLAEDGFAVASLDYRLAPKSRWPAQLEDVRSALRYLAGQTDKYQLDMARVALFGGSAGGHIALMAAYNQDRVQEGPAIRAVVAFYPITNLLTRQETDKAGKSLGIIKEGTGEKLLGVTRQTNEVMWKQASPTSYVNQNSPPTFLAHGRKDNVVNWEQTSELISILDEARVPHEVVYLDEAGHTFDLSTWNKKPLEKDLEPLVVSFLRKHLGTDMAKRK